VTVGTVVHAPSGVALARREVIELADRLGIAPPALARPGADLWVRATRGLPRPARAPLLRARDGWVHPGPSTAWPQFAELARSLGAPPPAPGVLLPVLDRLAVDAVDTELAEWMLPGAVVRTAPALPDAVPDVDPGAARDATVVVLGTAWATPLVGHVLARLGARVVKVEHPRRADPFPLHDDLVRGQVRHALDVDVPHDRDRFVAAVDAADLLVVGHPPRVLGNAGVSPSVPVLSVAAFRDSVRPGYGPAAEAHGGWAARHDPPRLGRTSVADPVAGMIGALVALDLLGRGHGASARVSLEGAVGRLLAREARGG
jgi:hypothetical protein